MAFLEELSKTLSDTGKEVATKAKALTGSIQLRAQISAEKSKLEEAYLSVGKKYVEAHPQADEERFAKEYEVIAACNSRISELEEELCQTEGTRICAECGAKVPKDSAFCGKCGAAMSAPVEPSCKEPAGGKEASGGEPAAGTEPERAGQTAGQTAGMGQVSEEEFESTEEY